MSLSLAGRTPLVIATGAALFVAAMSGTASAQYTAAKLPTTGFTNSFAEGVDGATNAVGYGANAGFGSPSTPGVFSGAGGSFTSNMPPTGTDGFCIDVVGTTRVGYVALTGDPLGVYRAYVWTGATPTSLQPTVAPWDYSEARATNGTNHVGIISDPSLNDRASVWTGTSNVFNNIHPASGYNRTYANDINSSGNIVGTAVTSANAVRAAYWSTASSASFSEIHPASYFSSRCAGISGSTIVGQGVITSGGTAQALLWTSPASASFVPMTPSGFQTAYILKTNGTTHVGSGSSTTSTGGNVHALAWTGTSTAALDLHSFLTPLGTYVASEAFAVDAAGNIVGYAATAGGVAEAVIWTPTGAGVNGWQAY